MGCNGRGHAKMRAERQTMHDFGLAEHGAHGSVGEERSMCDPSPLVQVICFAGVGLEGETCCVGVLHKYGYTA